MIWKGVCAVVITKALYERYYNYESNCSVSEDNVWLNMFRHQMGVDMYIEKWLLCGNGITSLEKERLCLRCIDSLNGVKSIASGKEFLFGSVSHQKEKLSNKIQMLSNVVFCIEKSVIWKKLILYSNFKKNGKIHTENKYKLV